MFKGPRFRFTGKVDFLSQVKRLGQFNKSDPPVYLNGQLVSRSEVLRPKDLNSLSTTEELKSYNLAPGGLTRLERHDAGHARDSPVPEKNGRLRPAQNHFRDFLPPFVFEVGRLLTEATRSS